MARQSSVGLTCGLPVSAVIWSWIEKIFDFPDRFRNEKWNSRAHSVGGAPATFSESTEFSCACPIFRCEKFAEPTRYELKNEAVVWQAVFAKRNGTSSTARRSNYAIWGAWKGQWLYNQWFFCAFCTSKQWRLLAQVSRTSDQDSSISRANSFSGQVESSKCIFSQAIVVFRGLALWPPLFFPTQNGWQKLTDYRDTAALTAETPIEN